MKEFFNAIRPLFGGSLTQKQVDGITFLLGATSELPLTYRAYILSTVFWESAKTMQPIEEIGKGRDHAYGKPTGPWDNCYYGRGYVQLTWQANYAHATRRLRVLGIIDATTNLEKNPELALRQDIALAILKYGMLEGWFTGRKLNPDTNYVQMRKIINGTDHADAIAAIAHKFETALNAEPLTTATATAAPAAPKIEATAPPPISAPVVPVEPQVAPQPKISVFAERPAPVRAKWTFTGWIKSFFNL